MRKTITIITLGILMLVSATAMTIYGGDSYSFETNLTNPVYTVTGNSSNMEGLNVTFENGNITISLAINYKPDNFTIIFFDNITREVDKIIYRGRGGSSRTRYVDNNVTVYVPEYINTTETIEVEVNKIIDRVEFQETGYELWMLLLAIAVGGVFIFFTMYKKKKKSAEEIMEDIDKDDKNKPSEEEIINGIKIEEESPGEE